MKTTDVYNVTIIGPDVTVERIKQALWVEFGDVGLNIKKIKLPTPSKITEKK